MSYFAPCTKCGKSKGMIGNTPLLCGCAQPSQAESAVPLSRFHELLKQIGDLHDKKQADYGTSEDLYANIRASEEWGIEPWVAALFSISEKMRRLRSLVNNGRLQNESADDSMRDIAIYALIALLLYEEKQRKNC